MKRWEKPNKKDRLIWYVKTQINRNTAAEAQGFKFLFPEFCKDPVHRAKCALIDKQADAFATALQKKQFKELLDMVRKLKAKEVAKSKR